MSDKDAREEAIPDLYELAFMPGQFRCPKCEFQWSIQTISVASGQIGTTEENRQTPDCPNDGTRMVNVTYREQLEAYADRLKEEFGKRDALLCPPHLSLDRNGHLEPFDNCIACIRVQRDELLAAESQRTQAPSTLIAKWRKAADRSEATLNDTSESDVEWCAELESNMRDLRMCADELEQAQIVSEPIPCLLHPNYEALRQCMIDTADENAKLRGQLLAARMQPHFSCKARTANTGANDPQECDWPFCGCDPAADKVISRLQESGVCLKRNCLAGTQAQAAQWISVNDGKPKTWAIVVIGGYVQRMAARLIGDYWEWADSSADTAPINVVTHWMPLPVAPVAALEGKPK